MIHKLLDLFFVTAETWAENESALKALWYRPPVGWCALECILIIEGTRRVRPSSPQA